MKYFQDNDVFESFKVYDALEFNSKLFRIRIENYLFRQLKYSLYNPLNDGLYKQLANHLHMHIYTQLTKLTNHF